MITSDQIPDEVEEAAARALITANGGDPDKELRLTLQGVTIKQWEQVAPLARAAIAAAFNAWPENTVEFRRDSYMGWDGNLLILPLP